MSSLREKSGPWTGWWIQQPIRGRMRLTLRFAGDDIDGGGVDRDGPFSISGSVDGDEVAMTKRYEALTVLYRGRWDGAMISGRSQIIGFGFYDEGAFEIWPEGEELSLPTQALENAEPVVQS